MIVVSSEIYERCKALTVRLFEEIAKGAGDDERTDVIRDKLSKYWNDLSSDERHALWQLSRKLGENKS